MKKKDKNYLKLIVTFNFTLARLKQYLSDEEIARLIALGLKEKEVNCNEAV